MPQSACPLAAQNCGGCQLLGVPYADQLRQKQRRVQRLLGRFAPVEPILAMQEPLHYRNKAIATFDLAHGKLVCGMYAGGTHRVLPTTACLLHAQVLNQTIAAVLEAARACRYTVFDAERCPSGLLRHMVLRHGHASGQVLVTLVTGGGPLPGSRSFVAELRRRAPWVTTVVQNQNPRRTSAVLGKVEKTLYGPGQITDTLCGLQFAISPRSFYQVNPVQTEALYAKAMEYAALTGKERVVDAYCGIGTIGLCAAPRAGQVVGVELNPDAARDAAANARRNRIGNARFLCGDATRWMVQAAGEGLRPDVVFLDPPRAGSTPECIHAVAKMAPGRVVYVSCDPDTLARDLALFHRLGYHAQRICPVDMFPQTEHVETIVLLQKETL